MSALTDHLAASDSFAERRFYSRVAPRHNLQIDFASADENTLLDVSENGFRIASPQPPVLNSVHRISLPFAELPRKISVYARTVWVEVSQGLAGLQLLDLNDEDRQLVRDWMNAQLPRTLDINQPSQSAGAQFPGSLAPPFGVPHASANDAITRDTASIGLALDHSSADSSHVAALRAPSTIFSEPEARPAASPLIFWMSALAVICLAGVWAFANNLTDSTRATPAHIRAAQHLPAAKHSAATESAPGVAQPSASSPEAKADTLPPPAHPTDPSPSAAFEPSRPPYSSAASRANSPVGATSQDSSDAKSTKQFSSPSAMARTNTSVRLRETPAVPAGSAKNGITVPAENHVPASPAAAPLTSTPTETSPASGASVSSSSTSKTSAADSVPAARPADAMPRTLSVDTIPPKVAAAQFPDANANSAASNARRSNSLPDRARTNQSLAPVDRDNRPNGKPNGNFSAEPRPSSSNATTSSVRPSLSASTVSTHGGDANSDIPRPSTTNTLAASSPSSAQPEPRVVELNPSSHDSYVYLPGERVIQAPAATMRIQRSVWVRGGHWFWHGRKKVSLGQLSTRVDPQMPRNARYGSITVQASIDKDGRIDSIRPLYGSPAFLLSVSKAIRGWQFEPTYIDSRAVETQAKIEIDFHAISANTQRP